MSAESEPPETVPPFQIPDDTIQKWVAISEEEPIGLQLTRKAIDYLFFGLQDMIGSQVMIRQALLDAQTPGVDPNLSFQKSSELLVRSVDHINHMMAEFMSGAVRAADVER